MAMRWMFYWILATMILFSMLISNRCSRNFNFFAFNQITRWFSWEILKHCTNSLWSRLSILSSRQWLSVSWDTCPGQSTCQLVKFYTSLRQDQQSQIPRFSWRILEDRIFDCTHSQRASWSRESFANRRPFSNVPAVVAGILSPYQLDYWSSWT